MSNRKQRSSPCHAWVGEPQPCRWTSSYLPEHQSRPTTILPRARPRPAILMAMPRFLSSMAHRCEMNWLPWSGGRAAHLVTGCGSRVKGYGICGSFFRKHDPQTGLMFMEDRQNLSRPGGAGFSTKMRLESTASCVVSGASSTCGFGIACRKAIVTRKRRACRTQQRDQIFPAEAGRRELPKVVADAHESANRSESSPHAKPARSAARLLPGATWGM